MVLRGVGQRVQIVERTALLPAVQLRPADLHRQPVVPLLATGQHQQVITDRVRDTHLRFGQAEGQLGTVEGP